MNLQNHGDITVVHRSTKYNYKIFAMNTGNRIILTNQGNKTFGYAAYNLPPSLVPMGINNSLIPEKKH